MGNGFHFIIFIRHSAVLRDAYLLTRNEIAKEMLIKYGDWAINIFSKLSDEQMQDMLRSEHGGLNEVLPIFSLSPVMKNT